jgi:hypothetical protein
LRIAPSSRLTWTFILGSLGCLPAYDKPSPASIDGGPDSANGEQLSGTIGTKTFVWELQDFAGGVIGYVEGSQLRSDPSSGLGNITIPVSTTKCGTNQYLVFEGTVGGKSVIKTYQAPKLPMPACGTSTSMPGLHVMLDDSSMIGVRATFARELKNQGIIMETTIQDFTTNWRWVWGSFVYIDVSSNLHIYSGGTVSQTSPDGTACRLFYTNSYTRYMTQAIPNLINFAGTAVTDGFLLLCPSTYTHEVTLTASSGFRDQDGFPATFGPINVPLVADGAALAEWKPTP